MENLFNTPAMAAGYARCRPAIHARILDRARPWLGLALPVERGLDVGCGAGLSTRALQALARRCLGIDPSASMVQCAAGLVPGARFEVGCAEALPVPDRSVGLITAAGSLNYADLDRFFAEAVRVLAPGGALVVYDFDQGRSFRGAPHLDAWFRQFLSRYPMPLGSARELSPAILGASASGLRLTGQEQFELGLTMEPTAYLDYVLTETNVAHAVRSGVPAQAVRDWCAQTLEPVFAGSPREVLFPGYLAVLSSS